VEKAGKKVEPGLALTIFVPMLGCWLRENFWLADLIRHGVPPMPRSLLAADYVSFELINAHFFTGFRVAIQLAV
jgi:hypothetical protein